MQSRANHLTMSPGRELKYNLAWIESTFKSRPNTEILLAPEREEGNLTTNDYELATRFLPGPHRYYPVRRVLGSSPGHLLNTSR